MALRKTEEIDSLFQGEGKRAWRARVRVIISRARRAHVACARRAASESLSEKELQAIYCMTLTASRCALGPLSRIRERGSNPESELHDGPFSVFWTARGHIGGYPCVSLSALWKSLP